MIPAECNRNSCPRGGAGLRRWAAPGPTSPGSVRQSPLGKQLAEQNSQMGLQTEAVDHRFEVGKEWTEMGFKGI